MSVWVRGEEKERDTVSFGLRCSLVFSLLWHVAHTMWANWKTFSLCPAQAAHGLLEHNIVQAILGSNKKSPSAAITGYSFHSATSLAYRQTYCGSSSGKCNEINYLLHKFCCEWQGERERERKGKRDRVWQSGSGRESASARNAIKFDCIFNASRNEILLQSFQVLSLFASSTYAQNEKAKHFPINYLLLR